MHTGLGTALCLAVAALGTGGDASADGGVGHGIAFHLAPALDEDPCGAAFLDSLTCDSLVVEGQGGIAQYLYVVVTNVRGLTGFEFGISFEGPFGGIEWYPCTDAFEEPFFGWPADGTSIALGWEPPGWSDVVGPDRIAVIGAILVGKVVEGRVAFIPRFGDSDVYLVDDGDGYTPAPADLGIADIAGGGGGYRPCPVSPTRDANWSDLKLYWKGE
jgi:hypothetical protein